MACTPCAALLSLCSANDGETIEELEGLVEDTVRSYGKHFFSIDLPPFSTESEPIDAGPLPIERTTPVSRIKPVFDLAA